MKNKLILSAILSGFSLIPQAKASDIITNTAHLQAMDKITGKVSEIKVPVNGLANFGTFSILVRKCVTKSPEETPENTAFVDIVDNYQTQNPVNIFKGWMFSSTPALNAVEHPIYDIWLLKCFNSDISTYKLLSKEQLDLRDTLPLKRPEPIKVSTQMTVSDISDDEKLPASADTETSQEITENNNIVNLDSATIATASETQTDENDGNFVSEGEEDEIEEIIAEPEGNTSEQEISENIEE